MNRDLRQLVREHRMKGTAIPAFGYSDLWDLKAIVEIGAETTVPIIVASNPAVAGLLGVRLCAAMVRALAEEYRTVLFSHLDHSTSVDPCIAAVDAGYASVMIDGSGKDLDSNIAMVKEVVRYAHGRNVMVEAKIGRSGVPAEADDVAAMAERSGVDAIAVEIASEQGSPSGAPQIDFDLLAEIAERVPTPLVLHGGSAIPDEEIRRGIGLGISKVNVGTIIHTTYMSTLKRELEAAGQIPFTIDVMREVLPSVEEVVLDRINAIAR